MTERTCATSRWLSPFSSKRPTSFSAGDSCQRSNCSEAHTEDQPLGEDVGQRGPLTEVGDDIDAGQRRHEAEEGEDDGEMRSLACEVGALQMPGIHYLSHP